MKRIFCICTEASGDLLLSKCIQAIQRQAETLNPNPLNPNPLNPNPLNPNPPPQDIQWLGIVGPLCAALGVEVLMDARKLNGHGFIEVLPIIPRAILALRLIESYIDEVDIFLLCDSPEINLRIVPKLDQKNKPYFYLAPPQIWAWRSSRGKILSHAKGIAVLFDFEKDFYQHQVVQHQVIHYIGHPMFDQIHQSPQTLYQQRIQDLQTTDTLKIALFPGSRKSSFKQLIKIMIQITRITQSILNHQTLTQIRGFQARNLQKIQWHLCISPWLDIHWVNQIIAEHLEADHKDQSIPMLKFSSPQACIASSHFALSCIGSVNLEIAALGCPQILLSPLKTSSLIIAKTFAHVPYASLINLVLKEKAFDEFYLPQFETHQIARLLLAQIHQMLDDQSTHKSAFAELPKKVSSLDFSVFILEIFKYLVQDRTTD